MFCVFKLCPGDVVASGWFGSLNYFLVGGCGGVSIITVASHRVWQEILEHATVQKILLQTLCIFLRLYILSIPRTCLAAYLAVVDLPGFHHLPFRSFDISDIDRRSIFVV